MCVCNSDERSDATDVESILVWEWQPHAGYEEEVAEYYEREIGPLISQSSQILRLRWFRIGNATMLKGDSQRTLRSEELHVYMCLVEMDCEEWPWDEIFTMNELPGWGKYFETQSRVVSHSFSSYWLSH